MVIEIQKVEYDYNFDRFLHYFLMLLAEQQRSAKEYKIGQNVFLILVMTQPYETLKDIDGQLLDQEMLVTTLHTEDSGNKNIPLYAHKLIALNPNHKHPNTPKDVRDWSDLIYESINNPEIPNINRQNPGIDKAANLIDMDKLTPEELEGKKRNEAAKTAKELYEQNAKREEKENMVRQFYHSGATIQMIMQATGFSEAVIEQIIKKE